jgi:hypothetical protein
MYHVSLSHRLLPLFPFSFSLPSFFFLFPIIFPTPFTPLLMTNLLFIVYLSPLPSSFSLTSLNSPYHLHIINLISLFNAIHIGSRAAPTVFPLPSCPGDVGPSCHPLKLPDPSAGQPTNRWLEAGLSLYGQRSTEISPC